MLVFATHIKSVRSVLLLLFVGMALLGGPTPDRSSREIHSARTRSFHDLPLYFEPNRGQTDPGVKFISRGIGYGFFLTPTGALLTLQRPIPISRDARGTRDKRPTRRSAVIGMGFVGADPRARITGADRLSGKSNYIIGNDPGNWGIGIPHYGRVGIRGLYPGIDLVYYGNPSRLEHDFVVSSGVDPRTIRWGYSGLKGKRIDEFGNLRLATVAGEVVMRAPVCYQDIGGRREYVEARYVLRDANEVGFAVSDYDRSRPLVIDPVLDYSTFLAGTEFGAVTEAYAVAADAAGCAYVTGETTCASYPTTPGAFQRVIGGTLTLPGDVIVAKFTADGSALVYSTFIGGTGGDIGRAIVVDGTGCAYVTGASYANFPTTAGAFQTVGGATDQGPFVAKLSADGSSLVYSTFLGTRGTGLGIAVDGSGRAHVTGYTYSTTHPTTAGAYMTIDPGPEFFDRVFYSELNATGSALLYSTYLGGTGVDDGNAIALDGSGNAYITGQTLSANFPTTAGAYKTTRSGIRDAFVAKIHPGGLGALDLIYSTYLGGAQEEYGYGIAVDGAGCAYVTGCSDSTDFPTTLGAFQTVFGGGVFGGDAFVTKLNAAGTALLYSTYLGGAGGESGAGIVLDAAGSVWVTGVTRSTAFPVTPDAFQTTLHGDLNAFLTELDNAGTTVLYSTFLGGDFLDAGRGIARDPAGDIFVVGMSASHDYPTTSGAYLPIHSGGNDAFVTKFMLFTPTPSPTVTATPTVTSTPTPSMDCDLIWLTRNLFRIGGEARTEVRVRLCLPGYASVIVYNSAGEKVRVLQPYAFFKIPVLLTLDWDGKNDHGDQVASGVYLVHMEGSRVADTKKLLVVR